MLATAATAGFDAIQENVASRSVLVWVSCQSDRETTLPSICFSAGRTRASNASPASVGETERVVRDSNLTTRSVIFGSQSVTPWRPR